MKKIQAYLDCVSPFSHHALTYLLSNRQLLTVHDVTVEIIPVFLGGIMQSSGNSPPWKVDAKATYLSYDSKRAQKSFRKVGGKFYGDHGKGDDTRLWRTPDFFPILSLMPQRVLTHLHQSYPAHIYESTFVSFFHNLWSAQPQLDLSKRENIIYAMEHTYPNMSTDGIPSASQSKNLKPAFTSEEIQSILEASESESVKERLKDTTAYCVKELGAFGCPWFWVINDERASSTSTVSSPTSGSVSASRSGAPRWGKLERTDGEPFFGSDRWHYIWEYLDIPWVEPRVLSPEEASADSEEDKKMKEVLGKL